MTDRNERPGFEEDLFVLSTEDLEAPLVRPAATSGDEIIILMEEGEPFGAPHAPELHPRKRHWLAAVAATAMMAAAVVLAFRDHKPVHAQGTYQAKARPTFAPPAGEKPAAFVEVAVAKPAPAPVTPAVVAPPAPPPPLPRHQPPAARPDPGPKLERGAECAVLLRNGRFFEGKFTGNVELGLRFSIADGNIVVTPEEKPVIHVRGTAGYEELTGRRTGFIETTEGRRVEGALYVIDGDRVVIGDADRRLEYSRADLRRVTVVRDVASR